ncbi:MAG TPA: cation transporter [Acidimicrobiales bacterium]|nr:cation transporter [Acidimicrobiales bacterium]
MSTATYTVTGMTCEHCVRAVSSAIGELPGVTAVDVDLPTGKTTVTSESPLDAAAVADALDDAGDYKLTTP